MSAWKCAYMCSVYGGAERSSPFTCVTRVAIKEQMIEDIMQGTSDTERGVACSPVK